MALPTIAFAEVTPAGLGIAHEVAIDPLSGDAVARIPVQVPPGRSGFGPALTLEYRSGSGNSPFGCGWSLSGVPLVSLDSGRDLPRYDGTDIVHFGFGGEMVPSLVSTAGGWQPRLEQRPGFSIRHWRARRESSFIRLEQWTESATGRVHWRSRDGANTLTIFGSRPDGSTRIVDPADAARVLAWLPDLQIDAHGNALLFDFVAEDALGVDRSAPSERGRHLDAPPQRYLKSIRYGNTVPATEQAPDGSGNRWSYTLVFDYGDHRAAAPAMAPDQPWPVRPDPHSTMRGGFDLRTWRLCRRVLTFHSFAALGAQPVLVRELQLRHALSSAGCTLAQVAVTAHRTDPGNGSVASRSVPPLKLTYSQPELAQGFEPVPVETSINAPAGLMGVRWVDLFGEGLPGLLAEIESVWYYKPNEGDGRFGPLQLVGEKPSSQRTPLSDFNADGRLDAAVLQGRTPGYFSRELDGGRWQGFAPIAALPHAEAASGHAQWMDLTGDGRQDLLVSEAQGLTWYPAQDDDRYGGAVSVARERGGAPVMEDPAQGLFFADLNGDGLPDQVRVRNGLVEYWPQLGRGRFADAPIVMEGAPMFAPDNEFDPRRIRFVRLGAGAGSDMCYAGTDGITFWENAQGNRWLPGVRRGGVGVVDSQSSISVLDFLGDGRPCLVWSSPLATAATAMQYLPLAGAVAPGMLLQTDNGLGRRTVLSYASSARHFLRDRHAGRPWRAGLAHHVLVAERIEVIDEIGGTAGETRYEYHDGYHDTADRRFVGFGLVDRFDGERLGPAPGIGAPGGAACERTWFHPGSAIALRGRLTDAYGADADEPVLTSVEIEASADWAGEELSEAVSSLAGRVIRTERYALDDQGRRAPHPIETTQHRFVLRRLQPAARGWPAGVLAYQGESLSAAYEGQPADPRAVHEFWLDVDAFGLPALEATVAYRRRPAIAPAAPAQAVDQVSVERRLLLHVDAPDRLQIGAVLDVQTFEAGNLPPRGPAYGRQQLRALLAGPLAAPLEHHAALGGAAAARRLTWEQHFFWNDARTGPAPFGVTGAALLPHHTEVAAFAGGFVGAAFSGRADAALVQSLGYTLRSGHWWQPQPVEHFLAPADFLLPAGVERTGSELTSVSYDAARLFATDAVDPVGNTIHAEIDYQALAPLAIVDANGTRSEVRYDPLGVVVLSTSRGSVLDQGGSAQPLGHELLAAYVALPAATAAAVLAAPASFVQQAGLYRWYDLDAWRDAGAPPREFVIVRQQYAHDGRGSAPAASPLKVQVSYFDGFGRDRQVKVLAEPGPAFARDAAGALVLDAGGNPVEAAVADRWLTSGGISFDRAQRPVLQFEPYYSVTPDFESEPVLGRIGASLLMRYDALGRTVGEDFPNGSFTRTEHAAWEIRRFDANDTVATSQYRAARAALPASDPERMALDEALAHASTPTVLHLDPTGRDVRQVDVDPAGGDRVTTGTVNAHGRTVEVVDPRGLSSVRIRYDMLDRTVRLDSVDAGTRWTLADVHDRPCHVWDGRGMHQETAYDALDRLVSVRVRGPGFDRITEQRLYGDDPAVAGGAARNARGRLVRHRDQAGVLEVEAYDLNGQALRTTRRMCTDYRNPPDWQAPGTVALDADVFRASSVFDALGQPLEQSFADGTRRQLTYAAGGGLRRVAMDSADGIVAGLALLEDASFNARGEQLSLRLGNGVTITRGYDAQTHFPRSVSARRLRPGGGAPESLQDLRYTYDPTGNLVHVADLAQEPGGPGVFLVGAGVSAATAFRYDHLGRLSQATGRIHQALLEHDPVPGQAGTTKGTRHLTFNNGAALERYTRNYSYDASGNLLQVRHVGQTRSWTTDFWVSAASNRALPARDLAGLPVANPEQRFDANGNCLFLESVRRIAWTERNMIASAVLIERAGGTDDVEYYVYDGNNLRVRKVTERLVGADVEVTEQIYLDGCEIKRVRRGNALQLERFTSHVSDGAARVALVNRWRVDTLGRETADTTRARVRYQLSTHVGSATLELDETGARISYEEYFPFGGTAFIAGDAMRDVEARSYRYCGKERDDSTGLYCFEHRYFAPWIGRFMSADPAGPDESTNLYLYAGNDPVNSFDPQGLDGKRRSAPTVRVQHIPWDSLPAQYQQHGDRNAVHFVLYGPSGDGPSSYVNFKTVDEMQAAAGRTPGAWIGIYDPRWQAHYEQAKDKGRKEEEARNNAEAMLEVEDLLSALQPMDTQSDLTQALEDAFPGTGPGAGDKGDGTKKKEGGGEQGQDGTTGGTKDATGGSADSTGKAESKDPNATGTHDADGSSTATTAPGGAGGTGGKGTGTGTSGTGPGAGKKGTGRGDGQQPGTAGGKGGGIGPQGDPGAGGTGDGNPADNPTPGATGNGTGGDGVPGGVSGGAKDGVQGGVPGGTGTGPVTGNKGGGGQKAGGDPNGDPNGSPTGSPKGTTTGTATTTGGNGGNGQTTSGAGEKGGIKNGNGTNPDAKGTGQNTGQPPSGDLGAGKSGPKATVMDKIATIAGYTNFEFSAAENGQSGGIPGGMGTHSGAWGQALYVALSVVSLVLMFCGGAGIKAALRAGMAGIKTAMAATMRLFTKEGLKRVGARISALWAKHSMEIALGKGAIRIFPVHAAWKAGGQWLHAAGSKPLYAAQQLFGGVRRAMAGGKGLREAWSVAWKEFGPRLTQLQKVATRGAEEFAEESLRFRLPSLFPQLAPTAVGRPVLSCITSTWNAWSRTNLYIPSLLGAGGAGYGIWRLFGGGSGDAPQQQEGTGNAGAR